MFGKRKKEKMRAQNCVVLDLPMITKRKTLCKEGQYISLVCQLRHYCNLQAIVFGSVCLC